MSGFRSSTLRQGLIWIVFAALLPMVIVSAILGFDSYSNTNDLTVSRLDAHAKAVAEQQREPFVIAQHLLMSAADNPDVREYGPGCRQALQSSLRSYAPSVNFVRADASGAVRCSVLPYENDATLATEAWWRNGIRQQGLTITPPVVGSISKKQVIILMLPIRTANGRQNGSLSTAVEVSYLAKQLENTPESRTGALAIVSASGKVVVEGGQPLPFKPQITDTGKARLAKSAQGQWMYTSAPIYGRGLFIVYGEPRETSMASAIWQFRVSTLLPLLSILLASLAIWLGTHWLVVRWLRELGGVAERFAKGDFTGDQSKFERAPAEIAELSAGLHAMADVLDKRNADLTMALDAKTELTREVHHRVKNNLQIITSLLTLQAARVAENGAKNVLGQTRARISALALIHRLLYEQDDGTEQGKVAIDRLLGELCAQLRSGNRNLAGIELVCHTARHAVPVDYAVPLALFVVEAVTNAYRHAFASGSKGLVNLEFKAEDDYGILTIADNGQGYVVDDTIGQMGTELMQAFATQVDGSLGVSSAIEGGTRVTLRFPLTFPAKH